MSLFSRATPPPRPAFTPPRAESPAPSPTTHTTTYAMAGCGYDGCTAEVQVTVQHDKYPLPVSEYTISEHECPGGPTC